LRISARSGHILLKITPDLYRPGGIQMVAQSELTAGHFG
jgi:hypothetical protein